MRQLGTCVYTSSDAPDAVLEAFNSSVLYINLEYNGEYIESLEEHSYIICMLWVLRGKPRNDRPAVPPRLHLTASEQNYYEWDIYYAFKNPTPVTLEAGSLLCDVPCMAPLASWHTSGASAASKR